MEKKKVKLKSVPGRVTIRPDEAKKQTDGGIVLPDNTDEDTNTGVVFVVGGVANPSQANVDIKSGDKVAFSGFSAKRFECQGEEFVSVSYSDILGYWSEV